MEVNFNFVQGQTLRQSDIVDYRAAYFAAKNWSKDVNILASVCPTQNLKTMLPEINF